MAHGFLESFHPKPRVFSAGTNPAPRVNPLAVAAMKEVGVDISGRTPQAVGQYLNQSFDYVITVCDDADRTCPNFRGKVRKRVHIGFPDPAKATGTESERLAVFRSVRDDIRNRFREFFEKEIKKAL
jgi:arsenate reductase